MPGLSLGQDIRSTMLRSSFVVFIAGWIIWFWIDKPRAGPLRLPPAGDSPVENFQRAFDILKAGNPKLAFVYIWDAHYLILSLLGGAVLAMAYHALSGRLSRRRWRSRLTAAKPVEQHTPPAPTESAGSPSVPGRSPGEDRKA
jgi:hypothetical protein